jgi:hydrogenase maturation protein HypF
MKKVNQHLNPVSHTRQLLRLQFKGAVQGVGFRPFIYRLATRHNLTGWVKNSPQGAELEVEGNPQDLEAFQQSVIKEIPPGAVVHELQTIRGEAKGYRLFEILESRQEGGKEAWILPDLATCPDCLRELFDGTDRRYRYPFSNCTHCGPRFSIIESLPYDRSHTTMKSFVLCPDCRREYEDPINRRFHAQPTACPQCGPQVTFWDKQGQTLGRDKDALLMAIKAIWEGKIVAVKGLGGFHLWCDARDEKAVHELRRRKHREEKPFAVMAPDLNWIKNACRVSSEEEKLLTSPQSPIVLLQRGVDRLAPSVAPENPTLGIMLPYTPLHHILLWDLGFPVVATSGNLSDEPICIDETEALDHLKGVADFFLVHNRPIVRPVDDSVARVLLGETQILRRARGYAPFPISVELSKKSQTAEPLLALGAHLKNTTALYEKGSVFLSQHIGDLDTKEALAHFERVAKDLPRLYESNPTRVVCDLHPDYASTRFAEKSGKKVHQVQHHIAHIFACAAENGVVEPFLGVAWDGTGLGEDGTVWGGEFFRVENRQVTRVGRLKPFSLYGGDKASREPRRSALAILYELFGKDIFENEKNYGPTLAFFTPEEKRLLQSMAEKTLNSPLTSSVGRLFDAASSILDLCQLTHFEGQAAMNLEFALPSTPRAVAYPVEIEKDEKIWNLDWRPLFREMLKDRSAGTTVSDCSARFHNALADGILRAAKREGLEQVVLSGGCFQNKYLSEKTIELLKQENFTPFWHHRVPPNDGGIALGQAAYILWKGE